jgi:uncharacterized protein
MTRRASAWTAFSLLRTYNSHPLAAAPGAALGHLCYLRDKHKREVDFLVVRDRKPWFLVEIKLSEKTPSSSLAYFQAQIKAPHVFQVVMNLPFEQAGCFSIHRPVLVPARTLLSQLP